MVPAGGGDRLHRRLRHLQRHHRARHPAARDALRRLQLLQGDRHLLPARAVDRHAGRDPEPARPRDGAPRQRRRAPDVALEPDERDHPGDPQPLLGARLLGRRRRLDRDRLGRRRLLARRRLALPQARRRHGMRDREDRRAAQPGRSRGRRRTASRLRLASAGETRRQRPEHPRGRRRAVCARGLARPRPAGASSPRGDRVGDHDRPAVHRVLGAFGRSRRPGGAPRGSLRPAPCAAPRIARAGDRGRRAGLRRGNGR